MAEQQYNDLEAAIQLFPEEERRAYEQAKVQVPHLVREESPFASFLSILDNDVHAAAERLILYWRVRRRVFGVRAFMPLNQTEEGALTADDVALLRVGFATVVENEAKCSPIVYFDRHKLTAQQQAEDGRLRVAFYLGAKLGEREESVNPGCRFFGVVDTTMQARTNNAMQFMVRTFPIRVASFHFLCRPPPGAKAGFFKNVVAMVLSTMKVQYRKLAHVHLLGSADLFAKLEENGIPESLVPKDYGGSWDRSKFLEWCDRVLSESASGKYPAKEKPSTATNEVLDEDEHIDELDRKPAAKRQKLDTDEPVSKPAAKPQASESLSEHLRLLDTIIQTLPDDLTAAYVEAKKVAPHLVEKESNALAFIRREGNDLVAAARRMALYWSLRKQFFGSTAFLMMSPMGEGTLSRSDMNLLGNGFVVMLPNTSTGHSVMCYDGSRLAKASRDCQLRVAFYILGTAAENPLSQTDGLLIIHIIDKFNPTSRDKRQSLSRIFSALPLRVKEVYAVCQISPGNNRQQPPTLLVKATTNLIFGEVDSNIQCFTDKHTLYHQLLSGGFEASGIPKSLGGQWGYESFVQWQELRTRYEWDLPPGIGGKEDGAKLFDFSNVRSLAELDPEERLERKRRMNVLHSRRKREREKVEIEVLREQCEELEEENVLAHAEYVRLCKLATEAEREVARIERAAPPAADSGGVLPSEPAGVVGTGRAAPFNAFPSSWNASAQPSHGGGHVHMQNPTIDGSRLPQRNLLVFPLHQQVGSPLPAQGVYGAVPGMGQSLSQNHADLLGLNNQQLLSVLLQRADASRHHEMISQNAEQLQDTLLRQWDFRQRSAPSMLLQHPPMQTQSTSRLEEASRGAPNDDAAGSAQSPNRPRPL